MILGPKDPETKNDCASEVQQKFTGLDSSGSECSAVEYSGVKRVGW
jgi:hypothetical protein